MATKRTPETTVVNVSDVSQTPVLLHGLDEAVWNDAGYVDVDKREGMRATLATQWVHWVVRRRECAAGKCLEETRKTEKPSRS